MGVLGMDKGHEFVVGPWLGLLAEQGKSFRGQTVHSRSDVFHSKGHVVDAPSLLGNEPADRVLGADAFEEFDLVGPRSNSCAFTRDFLDLIGRSTEKGGVVFWPTPGLRQRSRCSILSVEQSFAWRTVWRKRHLFEQYFVGAAFGDRSLFQHDDLIRKANGVDDGR